MVHESNPSNMAAQGWWLASDGRWYPPEQHPQYQPHPSAPVGLPPSVAGQVFRTPAIRTSGILGILVGLGIICGGIAIALKTKSGSRGVATGTAVACLGGVFCLIGISRLTARLEIHETKIVWTWMLARHEMPFTDLISATLIESRNVRYASIFPDLDVTDLVGSGIWWAIGTAWTLLRTGPTLGTATLSVVHSSGPPLRIHVIGTYKRHLAATPAEAALKAVLGASKHFHAYYDKPDSQISQVAHVAHVPHAGPQVAPPDQTS